MSSYCRLNFFAILSLVLLRLVIGWHFFQEGATKVRDGKFSSVGFLAAAKGPLADSFHSLIPDYEGWIRLDKEKMDEALDEYIGVVADNYGYTETQIEQAEKIVQEGKDQLKNAYERWGKEIKDYTNGIERIEALEKDKRAVGVATLRAQREEIESKWRALPKPALAAINQTLLYVEDELNALCTEEQAEGKFLAEFKLPGEPPLSTRMVDRIIPIFDMVIGILLMIGLLTPVASVAAALFLGSVVLSQFPGYPGTQPTYFQAVEMIGCLVLAGTDAGRFWGLDFIPWTFWNVRKNGWEYE